MMMNMAADVSNFRQEVPINKTFINYLEFPDKIQNHRRFDAYYQRTIDQYPKTRALVDLLIQLHHQLLAYAQQILRNPDAVGPGLEP